MADAIGSRGSTLAATCGVLGVLSIVLAALAQPVLGGSGQIAELPRTSVDTTYAPPAGKTIHVPAGGNFQAALDAARPGDVITLEAGAVFKGAFTLPRKSGAEWIVVRSSTADANLPPPGSRVTPDHASVMPKIVAVAGPALRTAPGAHHFRFIGVEVRPEAGRYVNALILLGGSGLAVETSESALPHHFIFDRTYLHGDPAKGGRRAIVLNSGHTAVIDSHVSDFKEVGADAQALVGWNGPGPFKIVNNYLEGAAENMMFGGALPAIPNLVPSDIEIRRNHFSKPLTWKQDDPSYAGTPWLVKNLFELKNARRVLIEGNVFEHCWPHGQVGYALMLTPRGEGGRAPWATVSDVTITNNIVRHTASAIGISGFDTTSGPSAQSERFLIKNNLFYDVGGPRWRGNGNLFILVNGIDTVVIDHNTSVQSGSIIVSEGQPNRGLVFRNNIVLHNHYGVFAGGVGTFALRKLFPEAIFERNVLLGANLANYPPNNFAPKALDEVGFTDHAAGDYRLTSASPYRNAGTDGKDLGADIPAVMKATAGVVLTPRRSQ